MNTKIALLEIERWGEKALKGRDNQEGDEKYQSSGKQVFVEQEEMDRSGPRVTLVAESLERQQAGRRGIEGVTNGEGSDEALLLPRVVPAPMLLIPAVLPPVIGPLQASFSPLATLTSVVVARRLSF